MSVLKLEQFQNALSPIAVTLLPIVTEVNSLRPLAKFAGILCTLLSMLIVVIGQEENGCSFASELKSSQFVALKLSVLKLEQFQNALSPIAVTLLPIVTEAKLLILYAKFAGILCTLSPMFIVVIGQEENG